MANTIYRLYTAKLHNYRCYGEDEQQVIFGKECTVIIGYNGAGKTAFLTGVKKAMSFILSRDRRRTIDFIGDGKDIRESTIRKHDVRYNYESGLEEDDYHYPTSITLEGTVMGHNLRWDYVKPEKRTPLDKMLFREQLDTVLSTFNRDKSHNLLPLLAFFSDCYPHVRSMQTRYEKDILIDKSQNVERRAGYYRWDASSSDFNFWRDLYFDALKRVNHPTSGLKQTLERIKANHLDAITSARLEQHAANLRLAQKQIEYVKNILIEFTKTYATRDNSDFAIEDICEGTIWEDNHEIFTLRLLFKDGRSCPFEMLPEGHKRLLAIAFEIASRFFVLNKGQIYEDMHIRPQGVAVIDELELHLHPTLAQEALVRLRETFPGVQFIVSTHSPAVISNVKNDGELCKVLKLDAEHTFTELKDCFGLDYSDTLVMYMGSYGRMHILSNLEEMYRECKSENDEEGISEVKSDLRKFFGDAPQKNQWIDDLITTWNNTMDN